ncbi:MAG: hypothetical protein E7Z93_04640 [Cyanobacteria bacterium SIG32]|nr:hypothetical protein [Cyanobacteria bacterium SIG32]
MENKIDISNVQNALETLKKSNIKFLENKDESITDMLEDSCVKRFEYTLETSWKLMKRILKKIYGKQEQELTVNNIFRFMQGYGFIKNWESWKDYYAKRNDTSHEYNLEKSRELLKIIPTFIEDADFFLDKLQKEL